MVKVEYGVRKHAAAAPTDAAKVFYADAPNDRATPSSVVRFAEGPAALTVDGVPALKACCLPPAMLERKVERLPFSMSDVVSVAEALRVRKVRTTGDAADRSPMVLRCVDDIELARFIAERGD